MNSLSKKAAITAIMSALMFAPVLSASAQGIAAFIFGGKIMVEKRVADFLPGGKVARKAAEKAVSKFVSSDATYFMIYEKFGGKTYHAVTAGIMFGPCSKGNNILGIGLQKNIPFIGNAAIIAIAFCNNLPSP